MDDIAADMHETVAERNFKPDRTPPSYAAIAKVRAQSCRPVTKLGGNQAEYQFNQEEKCVMGRLIVVCLQVASLFLLNLVGSFAHAQTPVAEQALAWAHDDPQLKWGPCPPFLPKGCGIAVLHGDPVKDNVDVFFKLPAKSTLPLHWHTSAERMVLVAGELHVTYDGQKTAVLKSGTYAYGPAKRPHKGFCASTVPCVLFIAFESPLDAVPVERAIK